MGLSATASRGQAGSDAGRQKAYRLSLPAASSLKLSRVPRREARENGYKKISLTASEAIADNFFSIPGVANLERGQDKNSVSFMFNGSAMTIMDKLHQLQLEDILIEEPSLEEIFLHYYE